MLGRWERVEYIAEGFGVLCCLGELVADVGEKWLGKTRSKHLERWSTIVLILALMVSLIALVRTNELSGFVIGSLGDKAEEADRKAKNAIEDADKAQTLARQASDMAGSAKTTADTATLRVAAVSKKAGHIDGELAWAQRILGARHILNEAGLEDNLTKEFKGKRIIFKSYVQDEEAFLLCKQLVSAARKPEVGVITEDECADEPLLPHLPVTDLRITAPSREEAELLGGIIKSAGVAGFAVYLGETPQINVLVGHQAAVPLFWPKAANGNSKTTSKTNAKP